MKKVRNKRRSHAEMSLLSISALYSKQRDHQTLRAARLLRMTNEMSSRSVSTPVIPQCLYAGYRSFLLRPIPRIQTLRNDEAAGVRGFTLVELLVVVLIIGILSAIAIPMYQGAVDKSRWSTLLTPAKALQTAQATAHLETGAYAEVADALVVSLPGEAEDNKYVMPDAQYTLQTKNDNQSTITGELTALPNVRLSMFMKHPESYLFCDAKTGDARAERLCNKLLGGTKASTKDGYTKYILDYPGTCAWANTTGQCYTSEEARCTALGMPYANGACGYTNNDNNSHEDLIINEGGVCKGTSYYGCEFAIVNDGGVCDSSQQGCLYAEIYDGGVCDATGSSGCSWATIYNGGVCNGNAQWGCKYVKVKNGGTCEANGGYFPCSDVQVDGGTCIANVSGCIGGTFKNGAQCIAKAENSCTGTYTNGSCCEDYGKGYCPSNAPKC